MKNSICRKSSAGGQELDATFTVPGYESLFGVLQRFTFSCTNAALAFLSGKPADRVRHFIATIRWPGMGGMGWDDPFELRGIKAAHVSGGCREF